MKKQFNGLLRKAMWVAIVLFVVRAALSWGELKANSNIYSIFGYAGEAIGVAAIVIVCYEKWLWRFDPLIRIPYIAGKYEGTLKSSYDQELRSATIQIKQTFLSVDVTLKTEESESRSVSGSIEEILGSAELIYTYLNEPKAQVRDRSAIHYGTATFVLSEKNHLTGRYYTDRNTSGDMDFIKVER